VTPSSWKGAYRAALTNALLFAALSWSVALLQPDSVTVAVAPAAVYSVGVFISFVLFTRSGGSFAAVTWFVLGTGIYFGVGTLSGAIAPDGRSIHYLSNPSLIRDLLRVNILNSSSTLIVLVSAAPLAYRPARAIAPNQLPLELDQLLMQLFPVMAALAGIALGLQLTFFPIAENLLLRNLLSSAYLLIPAYLLTYGLLWNRLSPKATGIGGIIAATAVMGSLLTMSKLAVISNLMALAVGIWMDRRTLRSIAIGLAALLFLYVVTDKLVTNGRNNQSYDAVVNSPFVRFNILLEALAGDGSASLGRASGGHEPGSDQETLSRFVTTDIQAYLMDQYDSGQPGDSLRDAWVALVPRLLWPGKPVVTRFGAELHAQFWSTPNPTSALAPTYSAEAYWNYGPIGVIVFSMMIGAEIGFFTRRAHLADATGDVAFFIVAFPITVWAAFVESWIAAQYIGGFVTLVALWYIARFFLLRLFVGRLAASERSQWRRATAH
jgi:hypothetical protein